MINLRFQNTPSELQKLGDIAARKEGCRCFFRPTPPWQECRGLWDWGWTEVVTVPRQDDLKIVLVAREGWDWNSSNTYDIDRKYYIELYGMNHLENMAKKIAIRERWLSREEDPQD